MIRGATVGYHAPMHRNQGKQAWKPAMMHTFDTQGYTTAITMSWNRPVGRDRLRADLSKVVQLIDREMLGPRFGDKPANDRTDAVFVVEGVNTGHVHVHSLWRAPGNRWFDLGKLFSDWRCLKPARHQGKAPVFRGVNVGIWNRVVPTGSHSIAPLNLIGNNNEVTGYILKGQHSASDVRDIIWAAEFHGSR